MLEAFVAHMRNDFNTSGALGALSKPLGEVNGLLDSGKGVSKAVRFLTIERFVSDMAEVATDRIRDELAALGVGVQDGPDGSVWSFL
jgi:cysteinyl-tRNA synthetase